MVNKPERKTSAWTPKCKWENNIKKDFKDGRGEDMDCI
jgi:hypothetical protein